MSIKTVGVLGCGLMGSGIAQTCAAAGYRTIARDVSDAAVQKGIESIRVFLDNGVAKGKVTSEARDTTIGNLSGVTDLAALKDCDLVIEAIVENLREKRRTYEALEGLVPPHAIFLSNTSSLCITELAATTRRPDRFGGLHFFNPVPLMKLVEVIRGLTTSDETYQQSLAFARSLGKEPVTAPDCPGFIVNRLLVPYSARCHPRLRTRIGKPRRHRRRDEARMWTPHGALHASRLCRSRHHLLHRQHHVRGVSRAVVCAAAALEADGARGSARPKGRPGFYSY